MSICPVNNQAKPGQKAFTLLESILTVVVIGVLITLSLFSLNNALIRKHEDTAQEVLRALWQAEQTYYSWHFQYTNDLSKIDAPDPARIDHYYNYTITNTPADLVITATPVGSGRSFAIDSQGNITIPSS